MGIRNSGVQRRFEQPSDSIALPRFARLHRAGWSIGDFAARTEAGLLVWVVTGTNGDNPIRARGDGGGGLGSRRRAGVGVDLGPLAATAIDRDGAIRPGELGSRSSFGLEPAWHPFAGW